jgi:ribosomal protein S18 acetylase RimI-like enzyme
MNGCPKMTSIKIMAEVPESLAKTMAEDLEHTEERSGVSVNYRQFSLILSLDNHEAIGVLNAYTAFAEIYIDDIWIHSKHRKKGYGKMLLAHLENHFKDKGFNNINLVTSEFQAPDFYNKCGYAFEFVRKNSVNPQFTKYFYVKFFDNKRQAKGLL